MKNFLFSLAASAAIVAFAGGCASKPQPAPAGKGVCPAKGASCCAAKTQCKSKAQQCPTQSSSQCTVKKTTSN